MQKGALNPGSYAGVRADIDHSRDALAQATDAGFFAGENGDVFVRSGDGAGGFVAAGQAGLQAQVSAGATTWAAELRIAKTSLGGWDHLVGLSFGHHSVAQAGDDYFWPYLAEAAKPNTWATTALGNQPVITGLEPYSATVLGPSFTISVEGSSFVSGTLLLWNGSALPTTYVDGEHLTAEVGATELASAALVQVTARAPASGNFLSNAAPFMVEGVAPVLTSLSPGSVGAGNAALTLTVNGSNFAANAQVLWNGAPLATQFVSATQLKAEVGATLLANGRMAGVAVRNPLPVARMSAVLQFEVEPQSEQPDSQKIYLPVISK
jgi:hypothetical protein